MRNGIEGCSMRFEISFDGLAALFVGQPPVWVLASATLVLSIAVLVLAYKLGKRR